MPVFASLSGNFIANDATSVIDITYVDDDAFFIASRDPFALDKHVSMKVDYRGGAKAAPAPAVKKPPADEGYDPCDEYDHLFHSYGCSKGFAVLQPCLCGGLHTGGLEGNPPVEGEKFSVLYCSPAFRCCSLFQRRRC